MCEAVVKGYESLRAYRTLVRDGADLRRLSKLKDKVWAETTRLRVYLDPPLALTDGAPTLSTACTTGSHGTQPTLCVTRSYEVLGS